MGTGPKQPAQFGHHFGSLDQVSLDERNIPFQFQTFQQKVRGDRSLVIVRHTVVFYLGGKCFADIRSSVERMRFRFGSNSPMGVRGGIGSRPFARFWSIRAYSIAYSCATMSVI